MADRGLRRLAGALGASGLLLPAALFLGALYVWPILRLLALSVTDPGLSLDHYRRLVRVPLYLRVFRNTFEIAAVVAGLTLLLGYPVAYVLALAPPRRRRWLLVLVLLPFFTSTLVRNYAWIFLLGTQGVVNSLLVRLGLVEAPLPLMFNRVGVLVGMVHIQLPYMILVLLSAMRGINPQLLTAASSLAAGPFTAFRRVFLPLSLPGVAAAVTLVFAINLAFYVTPAMLGGSRDLMVANLIATEVSGLEWGFAASLATVLLVTSLALLLIVQWLLGGQGLTGGAMLEGPRRARRVHEGPIVRRLDTLLNPAWRPLTLATTGVVGAFLLVPILMVVPLSLNPDEFFRFPPSGLSLRWYQAFFTSREWLVATGNSVLIALLTTGLAMALAIPTAFGVDRGRRQLALAGYGLVVSPLVMPSVTLAVAVFFLFSRLHLTNTLGGVVLGHTIGSLALATVVLVAALRGFDRTLERAAASLAAGPVRTVVRVTLPVLAPAAVTASFLAFLHSFDELLVALFVSGIAARTLPKKMWESLLEINPTIAAVSTLLVGLAAVALLALSLVEARRRRRTPLASGAEALPG